MGGWFGEVYTEYMAATRLAHVYKKTKKDEPAIGRMMAVQDQGVQRLISGTRDHHRLSQ